MNVNVSTKENGTDGDVPFIPLSKETFEFLIYIFRSILTPAISVIGLAGNSAGLIFLRKELQHQKHNFHMYMQILLANNLALSLVSIVHVMPHVINYYDFYLSNSVERYFGSASLYLYKLFTHFTALIIIIMSFERLMSLIRPLTFSEIFLFRRPRLFLLLGFVLISIFLLPLPLCCEYVPLINYENKTVFYRFPREDFMWFIGYFVFAQSLLLHFLAPVCILLINVSIPIAYYGYTKRLVKKLKSDEKRQQHQTKITTVTLMIVILYLLLSFPSMFAQSLDFIDEGYNYNGRFEHVFMFFISVGNFMTMLNSACDCAIYVFTSNSFLLKFELLCCSKN